MDMTQWAGVSSFAIAAAACLATGCRPWPLLAITNACFSLECALGWRHALHDSIVGAMGELYSERTPVQSGLIVAAIFLVALFIVHRRSGSEARSTSGASTMTLLTGLVFVLETISLHGVDAVLYRPVAGLLLIGWLWILLGGATVIGALLDVRHRGESRS